MIVDNILSSIDEDNLKLYKSIMEKQLKPIREFDNPEDFNLLFLWQFDCFTETYLKYELGINDKVATVWQHWGFLDSHFSQLFLEYEGSAFCHDKSRLVIDRIIRFYKTGEKIEFENCTFSKPVKILTTHDEVIEMYDAIMNLRYGKGRPYILAMKNLTDNIDTKVNNE
jgi:hypothetical protein